MSGIADSLLVGPVLVALGVPRHKVGDIAEEAYDAAFDAVGAFGRTDSVAGKACVCGMISDSLPPDSPVEQVEVIGAAAWEAYVSNRGSLAEGRAAFVAGVVGSANRARRQIMGKPFRVVEP